MRKTINLSALILLVSVSTFAVIGCSKKKDEEKKECQVCKVFKSNGEVLDQATVCSEEEKTAFQSHHPDNPAICQ